jgi:hypothetical protein
MSISGFHNLNFSFSSSSSSETKTMSKRGSYKKLDAAVADSYDTLDEENQLQLKELESTSLLGKYYWKKNATTMNNIVFVPYQRYCCAMWVNAAKLDWDRQTYVEGAYFPETSPISLNWTNEEKHDTCLEKFVAETVETNTTSYKICEGSTGAFYYSYADKVIHYKRRRDGKRFTLTKSDITVIKEKEVRGAKDNITFYYMVIRHNKEFLDGKGKDIGDTFKEFQLAEPPHTLNLYTTENTSDPTRKHFPYGIE